MRSLARALAACAALLLASSCATRAPGPEAFAFAVLGDTGYNAAEDRAVDAMIDRMNAEPLAFVVHVGDIKGAGECSDALYAARKAQFDRSRHPFVLTPGDNEWTDCRARRMGRGDPLERLARLREVFFADRFSMGRSRLELAVQEACVRGASGCECPALPENRAWSRSGVGFVTLHVTGSENNSGHDAANDAEAACRDRANAAWLERAVAGAQASSAPALVVLVHANPWWSKRDSYRGLLRQVEEAALRLRRPVLFVHGDTHSQRVDTPFADSLGNPVPHLTRLETYGSPFIGWVRVRVDPADPQVFTFEPRLHAFVPPPL